MIHVATLALCLAGFAALAFATRRQQREFLGGPLQPAATYVLRAIGTCALLIALGILVVWQGWGLGLVMFSGHTSLAAGIVFCTLIGYARREARTLQRR